METTQLITIATIAFLGAFGHCIGMCGGIVLAYTSTKVDDSFSKVKQILAHLSYSFGRVLTYTVFGVIFGYLGQVITFNHLANAILMVVAGIFMILAGLSILGKLKFLNLLEYSTTKSSWYQNSFRKLIHSKTLYSFFLLGMLNGLLPCGFVYFFAVTSASTASPFWGGVVMFIFGVSTIPALFSLGFFAGLFSKTSFRDIMIKLASLVVIGYGLFTLYYGYLYIKDPNLTPYNCPACKVEKGK
jgi:sulfite exporter TauE/SafE